MASEGHVSEEMDKERELTAQRSATRNNRERIAALIDQAWQIGQRDPHQALALSQEAYKLAQQEGVEACGEMLISSLINLGRFHYALSQLDHAQAHLEEALTLLQQWATTHMEAVKLQQVESRIFLGMGLIRWRLGDYAAALERLLLALDMVRKVGDKGAEANLLSNIGMVYGVIGEHQHAMNVYRQSLEIYQEHSQHNGYGMALNNMAMVCIQAGEYVPALDYARHSLRVAREARHRAMETNALDSAGAAYMGLGRLQEAFDHFQQSAALAAELGDRYDELAAWIHIGQLYARRNEIDQARGALSHALLLADELDDPEQIRLCHQELAQLYKEQGDFARALAHYEQYHEHDRAIYRERADMRFKTLQVMHETETARQEAAIAQLRTASLEKEIEERRRVEAALRESEARFRLLMEESPIGVHVYAADGRLLHCNRAWREMWDLTNPNWEAYNILRSTTMERLGIVGHVRRAFQGEPVRIPEVELNPEQFGSKGIPRWLRAQAYNLMDEGGRLKNVVLMIEDITEQKRSEEAVRLAQKMESLGALAGGVAHDFNNLLVGMLGQATLALNLLPQESAARDHVRKVVCAAEQAAELTQQMLAYSGQGHFTIRPLNLNSLIRDRAGLWQAAISHRVSLRLALDAGLPAVDGDASQIQQMILNLIMNGAEASGQGGVVTVSTSMTTITGTERRYWQYTGQPLETGSYLRLQVIDEAGGIPSTALSHIFDPFFTTKEQGRGLGLAAVLGIVRGHKAGVAVYNDESAGRSGAIFEILFPVSRRDDGVKNDDARQRAGRAATQGSVLVIDDEVMVREAVADILELENIGVLTADGGLEGLALYEEHAAEIELVLLDLSMPGVSGEETFRRLRALNPEVQVLLSSGYNADDISLYFDGDGPAGFLQKPYSVSALVEAVRGHLA